MAFERDQDWYTRGVGAIAARDRSAVRAVQSRRRRQMLDASDRHMSDIARLGGLGMVRQEGDPNDGSSSGPTYGGTGPRVYPTMSINTSVNVPRMVIGASVQPYDPNHPPFPKPPAASGSSSSKAPAPTGGGPKTLGLPTSTGTRTGGGGGGGSTGSGLVIADPIISPTTAAVDTSSVAVADVSADWKSRLMALPTGQKVALGAAVVGGLYLLFGRKK